MLQPDGAEESQVFWAKVARCRHRGVCRKCCWEWQGPKDTKGYGLVQTPFGMKGAHRYAWELAKGGPLLPSVRRVWYVRNGRKHWRAAKSCFCVLHRCDNPPCVNPSHLWVGTHWDNTHDAMRKRRWRNRRYAIGS